MKEKTLAAAVDLIEGGMEAGLGVEGRGVLLNLVGIAFADDRRVDQ